MWYALRPSQQPTVSPNYSQSIKINIGPPNGGTIIPSTHRPTEDCWTSIEFALSKRHLQMNIFCHFEFCHNRRNGFQSICFKCLRVKHCIGLQRMQKKGHYWRSFRILIKNSLLNSTIKLRVLLRLLRPLKFSEPLRFLESRI